jgi:hypothetical protein
LKDVQLRIFVGTSLFFDQYIAHEVAPIGMEPLVMVIRLVVPLEGWKSADAGDTAVQPLSLHQAT